MAERQKGKSLDPLHVLKTRIQEKKIAGVYLFYGEEEYTKRHYESLLIDAGNAGDGLNVRTFFGDEFDLQEFLDAAQTVPDVQQDGGFFEEDTAESKDGREPLIGLETVRVIRIVQPEIQLKAQEEKLFLSQLKELSPYTCVIFYYFAGEEVTKIKKGLMKKVWELALAVEFPKSPDGSRDLLNWVARHLKQKQLIFDNETLEEFCRYCGNSMMVLHNEIEKLSAYLSSMGRREIQRQDFELVCIKDEKAKIYDITNALQKQDFGAACATLELLKREKAEPVMILGLIAKSISDLCLVRSYLDKGLSTAEIARETGLKEYPVRLQMETVKRRGKGYADVAATLVAECDERLKSSKSDHFSLLQTLFYALCTYEGLSQE